MDQNTGQGLDNDLWGNQHDKPHAKRRRDLMLKRRLRELNDENTKFRAVLEESEKARESLLSDIDKLNYQIQVLEEDLVIWKGKALEKARKAKAPAKKEPKDGNE